MFLEEDGKGNRWQRGGYSRDVCGVSSPIWGEGAGEAVKNPMYSNVCTTLVARY